MLVQAADLAPPEIRDDVALLAEGMTTFDAALAAASYDLDALTASSAGDDVMAFANDPAYVDAGTRLGAYRTQVCHL